MFQRCGKTERNMYSREFCRLNLPAGYKLFSIKIKPLPGIWLEESKISVYQKPESVNHAKISCLKAR